MERPPPHPALRRRGSAPGVRLDASSERSDKGKDHRAVGLGTRSERSGEGKERRLGSKPGVSAVAKARSAGTILRGEAEGAGPVFESQAT